jgi:hypothetical protein
VNCRKVQQRSTAPVRPLCWRSARYISSIIGGLEIYSVKNDQCSGLEYRGLQEGASAEYRSCEATVLEVGSTFIKAALMKDAADVLEEAGPGM